MTNNVTVNFTDTIADTDPLGLGIVITEFGGDPPPIVGNSGWQNTLTNLAPGHLRCSIAYYDGNPGYGAGGGPGEQGTGGTAASNLITAIKTTGAVPLISFNGDSSDNGFVPADGASLVHFFNDDGGQNGGPVQYWSIGNEPEDEGGQVAIYESGSGTGSATATLTAMLGADSTINVGIPAAAYWDTSLLSWAGGISGIGCLSYHAYDALDTPGSDNGGGGFYETGQYFSQTATLQGYKSGILYGVEEFNANSNATSEDTIDFTTSWQETCWIADVAGQILSSGAHGTVFGDSNAGLSVISDGSDDLPDFGTPMPAYWGLGIWTGMNTQFKRWSQHMVSATTTFEDTSVSVYACDNGKIVLINKDTSSHALTIGLTLPGSATSGTYNVWATNASTPTDAITETVTQGTFSGSTISYTIPAQTAVSLDVFPTPVLTSPIYGVLAMPQGSLTDKEAIKAAGCNASMIQAVWSTLQPDGPGTALDSTAVSDLITEYEQCATAGLYPFFEIALQYAPSWILPGGAFAIETFTDQDGNVFDGETAPSGQQVSNWQWTATGRSYVAQFIAALGTALSSYAGDTYAVKIGGGYYGELHYPPSAIDGGYSGWGYGTSMQTGTGLSADQVVCPLPGYTIMSGTADQDTEWWNWYLNGLGTWLMWFIGQVRAAGWNCPYYVCHPGYGVRSNQTVQTSGYEQAAGEGEDPVRMIGFYENDPDILPYCTWLDAGADGFDPPGADSDIAAWKKVRNAAQAVGKQTYILGENTGGETTAEMSAIFTGSEYGSPLSNVSWTLETGTASGYAGIFWENYANLVAGGSNATLSDYEDDISGVDGTFTYIQDFENGTNGTTITTSNSGGGSDQAFDGVTIGTGCASTYSDAEANSGTLSGTVEVGSTATPVYWQWTSPVSPATTYFRFYVYLTAAPVADDTVIMWNVSGDRSCLFQITAAQKWLFQDNAFNEGDAFTSVIPLDQWTRLDGYVTWATSGDNGTLVMNYYQTANSDTPTETHTWTSVDTGAAANQVWVGWPSGGHADQPLTYWDDIGISTSYIPPVSSGPAMYTETLSASMTSQVALARKVGKKISTVSTVSAHVKRQVQRIILLTAVTLGNVKRKISRNIIVVATISGKVVRRISRSLSSVATFKSTLTNVVIQIFGSFHIVFPGTGVCEGSFNITIPGPQASLTGRFVFHVNTPKLQTSIAGKVVHNPLKVIIPKLRTSLAGKDVHNNFQSALPTVNLSFTGYITHLGSLLIKFFAQHMGAVLDEEIETPPTTQWQTGSLYSGWAVKNVLWKEWTVGYSTLLISHLSTEYVLIPVAATQEGVSYNPTGDEVQFAFMPTPTQIPGVSDWVTGAWETVSTSVLYPYNAKCLVGPTGNINLVQGTYSVYVKITDSPEVPVLTAGQLVVS